LSDSNAGIEPVHTWGCWSVTTPSGYFKVDAGHQMVWAAGVPPRRAQDNPCGPTQLGAGVGGPVPKEPEPCPLRPDNDRWGVATVARRIVNRGAAAVKMLHGRCDISGAQLGAAAANANPVIT
jgi:hypothetical protein